MRRFFSIFTLWLGLFSSSITAGENIPNLSTGYLDGFYLQSADGRYGIKFGSRLNFGYQYGFLEDRLDTSSFDLIHGKIFLGGNAFGEAMNFYLQSAFASHGRDPYASPAPESNSGTFTLEDYFVRLTWKEQRLKLGQFKVPFGRQWMNYSGTLQFIDRALATKFFHLGRDRGLQIRGMKPTFNYTLGIFNGGGQPAVLGGYSARLNGTSGQNASNDLSSGRGHLYVARLTATPFGTPGFSEGDVERSEGHRLSFGGSFAFDDERDADIDGNATLDELQADVWSYQGELIWKWEGFSAQGEYFYRHTEGSSISDFNSWGMYVQTGFFIRPKEVELAGRFSFVNPNQDFTNNHLKEVSGILNLYFSSDHRYKTQAQYRWQTVDNPTLGETSDHFIDLMFQFSI